jgi:hypothetical protein
MNVADDFRLPHVNEPPPNLALMIVGKALADAYRESVHAPLPECLALILRELEKREAADERRL